MNILNVERVIESIPEHLRQELADKLLQLILDSPRGSKIPIRLAKAILYYWQKHQLASTPGLASLIETCILLDYDETLRILSEYGASIEDLRIKVESPEGYRES